MQILEVPEVVVSCLCLRHLAVWLRLSSMNYIGKLHGILNEEDGDVVANDIPVALFGVKLDSETSNITHGVGRTTATQDSGESQEDGSLARCVGEYASGCDIGSRLEEGELSKSTGATSVNYTLRNAFMIESVDLQLSAFCSCHDQ
jgi:hypothetical protein